MKKDRSFVKEYFNECKKVKNELYIYQIASKFQKIEINSYIYFKFIRFVFKSMLPYSLRLSYLKIKLLFLKCLVKIFYEEDKEFHLYKGIKEATDNTIIL